MASLFPLLLLPLHLLVISATPLARPSPYLSPSLFFPNHQKMLQTFKIFIYNTTRSTPPSAEARFHAALLASPFATMDPEEAHLFYLHFPPATSPRSIARIIKDLQIKFPFWNRTLGADHFYVLCEGVGAESDRSLVELKKNSIQISCRGSGNDSHFIPHKDITLPTLARKDFVSNMFLDEQEIVLYSRELASDSDFVIKHDADDETREQILSKSKYCLFVYGSDISGIGEALRYGCVPVVIADSPMGGMVYDDVLWWTEIAVFVEGVEAAKRVMRGMCEERYERMREMGMMASKHFEWSSNDALQSFDIFHTVLYQLWLRRHTIRYRRRGVV